MPAASPTLSRARKRLGGAAAPSLHHRAGSYVAVRDAGGRTTPGVLLCADDATCDVWMEAGFVKRAPRDAVTPAHEVARLSSVATDAIVFASLRQGQRVMFERGGGDAPYEVGLLFEKCRWGGLIAKDDGTIFAVGFRRVWPLPANQDT